MGNMLGFGQKKSEQKQGQQDNMNYQQEQCQNTLYMNNCNNVNSNESGSGQSMYLLNEKQEDKDKKVVAVIVTLSCSGSYDQLFKSFQQKSMEGTKVEVYVCDSNYIQSLIEAFAGKPKDDISIRLMKSINTVDKDCVVFNWECCGGYSNKSFPENQANLFKFLKTILDAGHMAMFSDFSLKALINSWKDKYGLGPNPFQQIQQFSGQFEIRFKCGQLKQCPSAQLQIVGEMAEQGRCHIHAMGGTIVYVVNHDKLNHKYYKLQQLTVVTNIKPATDKLTTKIGEFNGSAGHVLLTYPSGGMILTSMGHWIQLMKIDTSQKKLFEVAAREFGATEANRMQQQYMCMDSMQQKSYVESNAREFVRKQAPCSNMNKKSKS